MPRFHRVEEVSAFLRYLTLVASRTSQTSSFASLAREAGVSPDTGLRWFGVLEATFLADAIQPYWRNIGKRLVKSPKVHFGDTGLAARMLDVRGWKAAVRRNFAGALLETLVAQHTLAFCDSGRRPSKVFSFPEPRRGRGRSRRGARESPSSHRGQVRVDEPER